MPSKLEQQIRFELLPNANYLEIVSVQSFVFFEYGKLQVLTYIDVVEK